MMFLIVIVCFILAFILPTGRDNEAIKTILTITGILYGVIVGFFITYLWNRLERMREFVNTEVSNLSTYYLLSEDLVAYSGEQKWLEKQRELIDRYVIEFTKVEWVDYHKTDPYFNKIIASLREVPPIKTPNEREIYNQMTRILVDTTTARENLFNLGRIKLTKSQWLVLLFLAVILFFAIFYLKTPEIFSIIITAVLAVIDVILLFILYDLNSLTYGETIINFEPYQRVLDAIGKPRFYLKKDIKSGRIVPAKNKEYRIGWTI